MSNLFTDEYRYIKRLRGQNIWCPKFHKHKVKVKIAINWLVDSELFVLCRLLAMYYIKKSIMHSTLQPLHGPWNNPYCLIILIILTV